MSQENVELMRRGYEELARHGVLGDWSWFFEEFAHDDIELWPPRYIDFEEVYRGRREWVRFWREWSETFDHFRYEVDAIIDAGGDKVLVMLRPVGRAKTSGLDLEQEETHVWTIRDGKMAVCRAFLDPEEGRRAAGLSP